jgi:hypothetical protein
MRPTIRFADAEKTPLVTEIRPANEREGIHPRIIPARAASNKRA